MEQRTLRLTRHPGTASAQQPHPDHHQHFAPPRHGFCFPLPLPLPPPLPPSPPPSPPRLSASPFPLAHCPLCSASLRLIAATLSLLCCCADCSALLRPALLSAIPTPLHRPSVTPTAPLCSPALHADVCRSPAVAAAGALHRGLPRPSSAHPGGGRVSAPEQSGHGRRRCGGVRSRIRRSSAARGQRYPTSLTHPLSTAQQSAAPSAHPSSSLSL